MTKVRIECYLSLDLFSKIEAIRRSTGDKGYTKVMNKVILEYFQQEHNQDAAINRLTKVIQGYEEKIRNLEHELKHRQEKE